MRVRAQRTNNMPHTCMGLGMDHAAPHPDLAACIPSLHPHTFSHTCHVMPRRPRVIYCWVIWAMACP